MGLLESLDNFKGAIENSTKNKTIEESMPIENSVVVQEISITPAIDLESDLSTENVLPTENQEMLKETSDFTVTEIELDNLESARLPTDILTRTEIVQKYVDTIFSTYNLSSANVSFFGDFVKDIVPYGYIKQTVDHHDFLIKENENKRLSAIVTLLDQIRPFLATQQCVEIPLCIRRIIEGSSIYSLGITFEEMLELKKAYPEYQFGYADTTSLRDLKLAIRR